jgi:hypothetical protein
MTATHMNKDDPSFHYIEGIVKSALRAQIAEEEFWSIEKVLFEDAWEADPLTASVEESFHIQVSDSDIDTDFAEDDDSESLTNCYVVFETLGQLADILSSHGVNPSIEVDFFNDATGSSISLLSDEDIENNVSLLFVSVQDPSRLKGLHANLVSAFGSHGNP